MNSELNHLQQRLLQLEQRSEQSERRYRILNRQQLTIRAR